MQIPVTLHDLVLVTPDETPRAIATFTTEAAARRVLIALKAEQGAGTLVLAAGADIGVIPRGASVEQETADAARKAGFAVNDAALIDVFDRVHASSDAVKIELGLMAKPDDRQPADEPAGKP